MEFLSDAANQYSQMTGAAKIQESHLLIATLPRMNVLTASEYQRPTSHMRPAEPDAIS